MKPIKYAFQAEYEGANGGQATINLLATDFEEALKKANEQIAELGTGTEEIFTLMAITRQFKIDVE